MFLLYPNILCFVENKKKADEDSILANISLKMDKDFFLLSLENAILYFYFDNVRRQKVTCKFFQYRL